MQSRAYRCERIALYIRDMYVHTHVATVQVKLHIGTSAERKMLEKCFGPLGFA